MDQSEMDSHELAVRLNRYTELESEVKQLRALCGEAAQRVLISRDCGCGINCDCDALVKRLKAAGEGEHGNE